MDDPSISPAGTVAFGPLTVAYDHRVLEPRPWTLLQSVWAAELAAALPAGPLLELCAGVGQIGLAAAVLAGRDLVQVEASPTAAAFARANADRAGWRARAAVREGRLQDVVEPGERFPLVLADPPYLPSHETSRWPGDPLLAIDGGPDGLAVVRECLAVAHRVLPRGGPLLLQVAGPDQAAAVARLVAGGGPVFEPGEVRVHDDARAVALFRAA